MSTVTDEDKLGEYLRRIHQIDRIVAKPVAALIDYGSTQGKGGAGLDFPPWLAESGLPPGRRGQPRQSRLTTAECYGTLQRVWRDQRRFPWLAGRTRQLEDLVQKIGPSLKPKKRDFSQYLALLNSPTYGSFNALSAAQTCRILILEGEQSAHTGTGFLCFFAMIWSLRRRCPDDMAWGASLGNSPPSAYVTAKCLLPIRTLLNTCWKRRKFLHDIAESVAELEGLVGAKGTSSAVSRWRFACGLEKLAGGLSRLAEISLNRHAFEACAEHLLQRAREMSERTKATTVLRSWQGVKRELSKSLSSFHDLTSRGLSFDLAVAVCSGGVATSRLASDQQRFASTGRSPRCGRRGQEGALEEAAWLLGQIQSTIVQPLEQAVEQAAKTDGRSALKGSNLPPELLNQVSHELAEWGADDYLDDLARAAKESFLACQAVFYELFVAGLSCRKVPADAQSLEDAFRNLGELNGEVATLINREVEKCARWCRSVVEREIAHVSAGNPTAFDPSELVSGITVAVRWDQMTTSLQVADAVGKAIEGSREDGSWSPGRPFFSQDSSLNVHVATADIVWMLTGALEHYPEVREADEVLMRFLDWLERSRITLRRDGQVVVGWVSERSVSRHRIDLWATALAVNALLEIRDLLEFRLWELCERRFTIIKPSTTLDKVDPVDLGEPHHQRLHYQLHRMALVGASCNCFSEADYALVLHGPPGSSKTTVAGAIAAEAWSGSLRWGPHGRLVRITPADFTGKGEDRLDSEARFIFDLLGHLRGVTVLFDEIDDLLRRRKPDREEMRFMELVIPAMLNRLADLREACPRQEICFLIATNYVEKIDPALLRKGRIDRTVAVGYPDAASRLLMIEKALEKVGLSTVSWSGSLVARTAGWPWGTIASMLKELRAKAHASKNSTPGAGPLPTVVEDLVRNHERSFTEPDYVQRARELSSSAALFDELVAYFFAISDPGEDFPGRVEKLWTLVMEKLAQASDPSQLAERLATIWQARTGRRPKTSSS